MKALKHHIRIKEVPVYLHVSVLDLRCVGSGDAWAWTEIDRETHPLVHCWKVIQV